MMKKEKWILKEIESWQAEEIIDTDTAHKLKEKYLPKKNLNIMIILFSIIGTLFIGMGIILIGAHNLWYRLPIVVRTIIGFLPLVTSQALVFYVNDKKMDSVPFREGAAILNMAGVFASIAIVSQIFHLSGDFTNYILVCGILSFPSMIAMKAVAPLAIYYWTALNGGIYIESEYALLVTAVLFIMGAVYAVWHFKEENGKARYLSWISLVGAFILVFMIAESDTDWMLVFLIFFAFITTTSQLWDKAGQPLKIFGVGGLLVMLAIATYSWCWEYSGDWTNVTGGVFAILMAITVALLSVRSFKDKSTDIFTYASIGTVILRFIWILFGLHGEIVGLVFSAIFNVAMFLVGVILIVHGVKNTNLVSANLGMITVCTVLIMRFFDSQMSLGLRGVVFLVVGIGFLIFNMRLVGAKKVKEGEL